MMQVKVKTNFRTKKLYANIELKSVLKGEEQIKMPYKPAFVFGYGFQCCLLSFFL